MSVRVFPKQVSNWVSGLSKADGPSQIGQVVFTASTKGLNGKKVGRRENSPFLSLCLSGWDGTVIFFSLWHSWFSGLQTKTGIHTTDSPALRCSNCIISFLESQAWRWPSVVGLLNLQNLMKQFFMTNLILSLYLYIFHGFCFSGEHWLIYLLRRKSTGW